MNLVPVGFLCLALCSPVFGADYFVVVPVRGKTETAPAPQIKAVLTSTALPGGVVGTAYAGFDFKTALSVTGDSTYSGSGVQWSVIAGALPAGLSLSAAGLLAGTPTVAGAQAFTLQASYKNVLAEQAFNLTTISPSATWNSLDKAPGAVLAGDTATVPGGNLVRATIGKSSGKWYWEVKVTSASYGTIAGVATSAARLNSFVGSDGAGAGLMSAPPNPFGYVCYNGCGSNPLALFNTNDVLGFALDMNSRVLNVYRNGALKISTTLPAGTWYPAVGGQYSGTYVANFGSQGFWQTPPAGYSALQ